MNSIQRCYLLPALAAFALLLAACAAPPAPAAPTSPVPAPTQPADAPVDAGLPLHNVNGRFFSTSGKCAICHTNMVDESGADVSTDSLWRATMMANAARDPYWQAAVRSELLSNPHVAEAIQDKCATCHTPMARFTLLRQEAGALDKAALFDGGLLDTGHELHPFAADGVSCTLCHQVRPENFGQAASFSGNYAIDAQTASGQRTIYGPFAMDQNMIAAMQAVSGFKPEQGVHMQEADLCGVCHNLYTPYLDATGEIAGQFPEQMIYSEWAASSYKDEKSCQTCHMPLANGGVKLSTVSTAQMSPFLQHYFVGGNTYVPQLLSDNGQELQVTATQAHLERQIGNARQQLQNASAKLAVEDVQQAGGKVSFSVVLNSQVGHKFPGGFPSRRLWLHVTLLDSAGKVVFESGAPQPDGSIAGNDNDEDAAQFEPHYEIIRAADQVQIYEAILQNTEGQPTTVLLKAAGYAKDNRLLPAGFDKAQASPDIAPDAAAAADADFLAGGDRVRFEIPAGDATGPFTVKAELLYQTVGYRWADNLAAFDAPETRRFTGYAAQAPNLPERIAAIETPLQ